MSPARGPNLRGTAARLGLTRANARKFRPRMRRRSVALLALFGVILVATAFWATLRQTALLRQTLETQLSESFGAKVTIDKVDWNGWSTIMAEGLTLRVPGWAPPSDEVASIKRAVVSFQPTSILSGKLQLVDMEVDGLTIRLVEDAESPGKFNLLSLKPKGGGGSVGQPRKALMRDLQLQLGVLRNGRMELVAHRAFTGAFEHVPDNPSLYSFELSQIDLEGRPLTTAPIRVFGIWDERTFGYEITLDSLNIEPETIALLPLHARTWAETTKLTGRVESARLSGNPTDMISSADVQVRDVTFRERDTVRLVPWARMVGDEVTPIRGDVTVRLPRGTFTLRGSRAEIATNDARLMPGAPGSGAVEIPIELRFGMDLGGHSSRPFDWDATENWLSNALNAAPFDLRVKLAGVTALPGDDGKPRPVELPLPLVEVLREFGARDWLADIDLNASRPRGTTAEDGTTVPGKLAINGRLALSDGTLRYDAFPYKLDRVTGLIEFDGSAATITDLAGRGTGNATLRIGGTVQLDQDAPAFSIRVVGTELPIDDRLMNGLDPTTQGILGSLLDRHSFQSLREANLSDDTWAPGGLISLDLNISQQPRDPSTLVEGIVTVHEANVVLDSFPYPMRAKGAVHLRGESVELVGEGFTAVTPSGSTGMVGGRIDIPGVGDDQRVLLDLHFDFKHEQFSALLLAAIPMTFTGDAPAPPGWPGATRAPSAELLSALGATGGLDIAGTVRTGADGRSRVETAVKIQNAAVRPTPALQGVLQRFGLSWPAQMTLDDVQGTLTLTPEGLNLTALTASRGAGKATARGKFATGGETGELFVQLWQFPLLRDFIGVAGNADLSAAYRAWDALQPTGIFDGSVSWSRDGDTVSTAANATLTELSLAGGQALKPICGEIAYRDGSLAVHELELHGTGPTGTPIVIKANGEIIGDSPELRATATGMTLASPLVEAGLLAASQRDIATTIREWRIDGGFDAQLEIGGPSEVAWRLRVEPTWAAGDPAGGRFSVLFREGAAVADPSGVRFEGLRAGVMHGELALSGSIGPNAHGETAGDLVVGVHLAQWSPDLEALLPQNTRAALRGIEFYATAPVTTDALRIRFTSPANGPSEVSVEGKLEIARGNFRTGPEFTEADGTLDFHLRTRDGRPHGEIALDFARLFVMNREASDVHARLVFDGPTNSVSLTDLEAWMYGGRMVGRAHAIIGGAYQATVSFVNVQFASFAEANDTPDQRANLWAERGFTEGPGRMRGRLDLSGVFGVPEAQRGVGRVMVVDAKLVEFPLGLSLLQLTQLMLPLSASLERADIEFEVVGDVLTFERFLLASSTLRLEGSGSMSMVDGDLALRFRNRGTLPLVSDILGAVVGDQVFMIDVGGTFKDPKPHLVPIPILAPEPTLPAVSAAYHTNTHE